MFTAINFSTYNILCALAWMPMLIIAIEEGSSQAIRTYNNVCRAKKVRNNVEFTNVQIQALHNASLTQQKNCLKYAAVMIAGCICYHHIESEMFAHIFLATVYIAGYRMVVQLAMVIFYVFMIDKQCYSHLSKSDPRDRTGDFCIVELPTLATDLAGDENPEDKDHFENQGSADGTLSLAEHFGAAADDMYSNVSAAEHAAFHTYN